MAVQPRRPSAASEVGATHLALFRGARRTRRPLAAARQFAGRLRTACRPSHVTDQHRHGAARDARRTRSGLPDDPGADPPTRRHPRDPRSAGGSSGASAQLVRHPNAGASLSPICLDRRQRESCGGSAHAHGGPGAGCKSGSDAGPADEWSRRYGRVTGGCGAGGAHRGALV